jgi:hypothetical protein
LHPYSITGNIIILYILIFKLLLLLCSVLCILGVLKILTGKPTGKRPLGRPRRRWEDNIRMDLKGIGINAGNWVDLAQDRDYWRALVNAALNLRVT